MANNSSRKRAAGMMLLAKPFSCAQRSSREALDELVNLIDSGKISGKQGKEVFAEMFASGKSAVAIVREKGIEQLSDVSTIEKLCDEVIAANPKPVADFKVGNAASLN